MFPRCCPEDQVSECWRGWVRASVGIVQKGQQPGQQELWQLYGRHQFLQHLWEHVTFLSAGVPISILGATLDYTGKTPNSYPVKEWWAQEKFKEVKGKVSLLLWSGAQARAASDTGPFTAFLTWGFSSVDGMTDSARAGGGFSWAWPFIFHQLPWGLPFVSNFKGLMS